MAQLEKPMRSVRLAESVPLREVADWLSVSLPPAVGSVSVLGISTDTRSLQAGDLFVALRGALFDAHDFLVDVREAGAVAAVVEAGHPALSSPSLEGWPLLVCNDTRQALGALGRAWRQRYHLPVVAITGSNGKTTTKELVTHLFASAVGADAVLSTLGNFNNEIGLPLTLLRLGPQHRYAVIELGMSHPGEIATLAQLAQPSIAIVTNAQRAHLAGMGSLAGVADEKGSLFDSLPENGTAIVNLDDPHANTWLQRIPAGRQIVATHVLGNCAVASHVPTFTTEVIAQTVVAQKFKLQTEAGEWTVDLPLAGRHNSSNALQALAAGAAAGLEWPEMLDALRSFAGVAGRLQGKAGIAGATIIDDTYNANPDSMRAAVNVLMADATGIETILVVGDMGEIGSDAAQLHAEVGRYAAERGVGALYAVGPLSISAVTAYAAIQPQSLKAQHFNTQEELVTALRKALKRDVRVLVKGSRSSRMENVVNALVEQL